MIANTATQVHDPKHLSTLAATAALAAQICSQTADGKIVLSRWGHAATFETVAEANAWLDRVTGDCRA